MALFKNRFFRSVNRREAITLYESIGVFFLENTLISNRKDGAKSRHHDMQTLSYLLVTLWLP